MWCRCSRDSQSILLRHQYCRCVRRWTHCLYYGHFSNWHNIFTRRLPTIQQSFPWLPIRFCPLYYVARGILPPRDGMLFQSGMPVGRKQRAS
jgi:hypothetical protein